MIVSKFIGKNTGKTYIAITVKNTEIQDTKNPEYKRIVLESNHVIGLDNKQQAKVCEIINLDKLVINTK